MARRKNLPESVRVKCDLSERLREIRIELHGERGGSEMARRLGLPIRTWYNYESGVTVPAEVMLKFVELTSVEPGWLLNGAGAKFRSAPALTSSGDTVEGLLRTALRRLESGESSTLTAVSPATETSPFHVNGDDVVLIRVEGCDQERLTQTSGARYMAARREWLAARRDCRCVRIEGEAMSPVLSDGAYVAFSETAENLESLDGCLVVAWFDGRTVIRWFGLSGRFGVLRAENAAHDPATLLLDLTEHPSNRRIRRVLWISTPH